MALFVRTRALPRVLERSIPQLGRIQGGQIIHSQRLSLYRPGYTGRLKEGQVSIQIRNFHTSKIVYKQKITKQHLLDQAQSPLARLWVHIKWPLTRNNRPFGMDDFSAFASWLVMGNVLWIILGTTTFGLVTMYSIDKFDKFYKTIKGEAEDDSAQLSKDDSFLGYLAGAILSHGLGVKLVFEKGKVVPEFSDGMLKFKNVKVYTTQPQGEFQSIVFSAAILQINMSLSFKKWYEGHGLMYNLEIFGMHAKVYKYDDMNEQGPELVDADKSESEPIPLSAMAMSFSKYNDVTAMQNDVNEHNIEQLENVRNGTKRSFMDSHYQLEHVKVHDSLVELYENQDTTPFLISIFNCDMPRLRGDRLLLDFFNASNVTGAVNNALFTIHKHQTLLGMDNVVRFKLDSINMGSLSRANPQLKFNWIANGKAEIVADIRLPPLDDTNANANTNSSSDHAPLTNIFLRVFREFQDLTSPRDVPDQPQDAESSLLKGAITALYETFANTRPEPATNDSEYVIVNFKVKFSDLQATLPLHLPMAALARVPFITLQNLRAIITYVNSTHQDVVIKTTVIEKLEDLYNLDNLSQTRVFDAIVSDIYDDLMRMIKLDERRIIEEHSSNWSQSVVSQLLLLGLGVLA